MMVTMLRMGLMSKSILIGIESRQMRARMKKKTHVSYRLVKM